MKAISNCQSTSSVARVSYAFNAAIDRPVGTVAHGMNLSKQNYNNIQHKYKSNNKSSTKVLTKFSNRWAGLLSIVRDIYKQNQSRTG